MATKHTTAKKNASAAAKRTAQKGEKEIDARAREEQAARAVGSSVEATHEAHPESPTDSSVRHAEPPQGKQRGEGAGGYPTGEYDVTPPPKSGAAKTKGVLESILDQHAEQAGGQDRISALVQRTKDKAQLSPDQFDAAVEGLPVGAVIEHEAENRWRVHVTGQNRFGHGATHSEAVEAYILGPSQPS
jgi:hypothetical protein